MTRNRITQQDIQNLGNVFLRHRGRKNALSKVQLYKEYYGKTWDPKSIRFYEQVHAWGHIRKIMKYLRAKGEHFIIYEPLGVGRFQYYLLSSRVEGEDFKEFLQKIIDAYKATQKRCDEYMNEHLRAKVKVRSQ